MRNVSGKLSISRTNAGILKTLNMAIGIGIFAKKVVGKAAQWFIAKRAANAGAGPGEKKTTLSDMVSNLGDNAEGIVEKTSPMANATERQAIDMTSDSNLSKSIRPVVMLWLMFLFTFMISLSFDPEPEIRTTTESMAKFYFRLVAWSSMGLMMISAAKKLGIKT
jgi:hypothetical protein